MQLSTMCSTVKKNNTVERQTIANKQLTDTITKLQEDNAKLLHIILQLAGHTPRTNQHQPTTPRWDPKGYCHTHGYKVTFGYNSKTCKSKRLGIKMTPLDKTQWKVVKRTKHGNQNSTVQSRVK
ncbi:hypothetical protein ACHAW6_007002 [Cyclotella cf. meneghiniana]